MPIGPKPRLTPMDSVHLPCIILANERVSSLLALVALHPALPSLFLAPSLHCLLRSPVLLSELQSSVQSLWWLLSHPPSHVLSLLYYLSFTVCQCLWPKESSMLDVFKMFTDISVYPSLGRSCWFYTNPR